ncbi:uncharacterized protein LOC114404694 [Glycine soja]|uniref:uncharacterized protein LOC114404694 n=1 Tax=Glycine soja TaxID=3848 RepID=UPI00103F7E60|nr:uncharacterized protein LOC114404694 [Glycine soja]
MDRSWMRASGITAEYGTGVEQFLQFTEMHAPSLRGKYFCLCVKCANGRHQMLNEIRSHLICHGVIPNYTNWIWHGELPDNPTLSHTEAVDVDTGCRIEEMIRDLGQDGFRQAHAPLDDKIENDSKTHLYSGCTTFTRLYAVLALVNLKARFGWSDKSFTELLVLLKKLLPEDNMLPKSQYKAKKILCPVGMEYQKIHACPNDCILYRNEYAKMRTCPTSGVSRYKVNNHEESDVATAENSHPTKVCWYLPIIPRFRRLFANRYDAKQLMWHVEGRKIDGLLRHPADSPQWKAFDALFPNFGNEARNLRLGLAFDGMNPFGNLNTSHSSWPVLLMIYNLPPWLCMKRKYIMLCMMIAGPRQPSNDIDVYLTPASKISKPVPSTSTIEESFQWISRK